MTRKLFILLFIVCVLQTGFIVSYGSDIISNKMLYQRNVMYDNAQKDSVNVVIASKSRFVGTISTYGKVKSRNYVVLKVPNFASYRVQVEDILFESGTYVNKDDILVKFRCDELMHKLQSALQDRQQHYNHWKRIEKAKSSVSESEYNKALTAYEKSKADYEALKASFATLIIKAPFDGVVGLPNIVKGEYPQADKVICSIVDQDLLAVEFYIDVSYADSIYKGMPVLVEALDGEQFIEAIVDGISPYIDENTSKIKVVANIRGAVGSSTFKHNMSVMVSINKTPLDNVFVLPRNAVVEDGNVYYVCKAERKGSAFESKSVRVYLIDSKGDSCAVDSDFIKDGDYVVIEGIVRRDSVPLSINRIFD